MQQFLSQAGYLSSNIWFVPCSGLSGINLTSRSHEKALGWYTGPTLLECLGMVIVNRQSNSLERIEVPSRPLDSPLRISVTDIAKGSRTNVVNVVGRVESGFLQVGDNVIAEPGGNHGTVRSNNPWVRLPDSSIAIASERSSDFCVAGDVVTVGIHGIEQSALRFASCISIVLKSELVTSFVILIVQSPFVRHSSLESSLLKPRAR